MQNLNIFPDKILHEKMRYVCKHLSLQKVGQLKDEVGIYAYILKDKQSRMYLFATKRYIDWSPKNYGRVSFTKSLVVRAANEKKTLVMLIEEKDGDTERNYIYTFNPTQIMETGYTNLFNNQEMVNFDIDLALNMEVTRRREIQETRIKFKEAPGKDKSVTSVLRYV